MRSPTSTPFDLLTAARKTLAENGFQAELGPEAEAEVATLGPLPEAPPAGVRDLRALPWSSIDNEESKDLDQIEVAEALPDGAIRVRVGVADVDVRVPQGSAIDARAATNTSSVYTGVLVFPMLPERLSTDLTSLNEGVDRLAIVIDVTVGRDGSVVEGDVYRAAVHNHVRLTYVEVGDWLDGVGPIPPKVLIRDGMEAQLRLQDEAARRLKVRRHERGALELETVEARPVAVDGQVVDLTVARKSRSRELIEDFMIAANGAMARFLEAKGRSALGRVVKTPARWPRILELAATFGETLPVVPDSGALNAFLARRRKADPPRFAELSLAVVKLMGPGEYTLQRPGAPKPGHFGLAAPDYTHSTAPNRRYSDLVTQRLLKAALTGDAPPYSDEALAAVAARCTQKEHDARKVERTLRKVAAALLLQDRIGETFAAVVTGVAEKGTFVRLISPAAEGRVVRGEKGLDVGDEVAVRLVATEPSKGFLDFVRA